jgi:hypothetical protein
MSPRPRLAEPPPYRADVVFGLAVVVVLALTAIVYLTGVR